MIFTLATPVKPDKAIVPANTALLNKSDFLHFTVTPFKSLNLTISTLS